MVIHISLECSMGRMFLHFATEGREGRERGSVAKPSIWYLMVDCPSAFARAVLTTITCDGQNDSLRCTGVDLL